MPEEIWGARYRPSYPLQKFLFEALAIGLHLLQNPTCAQHYDDSRLSILAQRHQPLHLSALEATFIKTSNPALCRQNEFVYSLKIVY